MKKYKSILWLDDLDEQRKTPGYKSDSNCIHDRFGSLHGNGLIHHIKKYSEAIKAVTSGYQYDLVVFDMNWADADLDIHIRELARYGIIVNMPENNNKIQITPKEFFISRAGAYLYQLLLLQGYPSDRMIILTNNEVKVPKKSLEESGFSADKLHIMQKEDINTENPEYSWDQFFQEDYFYYRIRRLILQACHHWKNYIKQKKPEDIAFNKIYFPNTEDKSIPVESFNEILERIELLFPVVKPDNPKRVYYHAMQIIAMVHEKSANLGILDKQEEYKGLKKYHSMIRNFRNWSSHNRFEKTELDGEQFALLFCIALRTIFDDYQDSKLSDLYPYEKVFDFNCTYETLDEEGTPIEIELNASDKDLNKKLNEIFDELLERNIKESGIPKGLFINGELSDLIYEIPQKYKYSIDRKYLFTNLWCMPDDKKDNKDKEVNKIKLSTATQETDDNHTFQIKYYLNIPQETCEKIFNSSKENSPEAIFMCYCYRWI